MGCTTSQATSGHPKPSAKAAAALAAQKKKNNPDEIRPPSAQHPNAVEESRQRHDSEVDLTQTITAERAALRELSSKRIIRKLSFEDLLDSLTTKEYDQLCSRSYCFQLQKEYRIKTLKNDLTHRTKSWVVYNNLEAITDFELTILGVYLMGMLRAVNNNNSHGKISLPPPQANHLRSSTDLFKQSFNRFPTHHAPSGVVNSAEPITSGPYLLKMEEHIRDLRVVAIAPLSRYEVSSLTLYDYELPPGLITINEAISVIELFQRGGRLNAKSVHKILRLGYKLLKQQSNITPMTITEKDKLTVVGDIHGQLADLLHILTASGLPSTHNKYIFNGDFVDRGEWGVEVMCILLTLFIARPDCVVLNRGNHEDFAICSVYGFQLECYEKYDALTFSLFVEVFQQIPLFATINNTVFVVHGGLFHNHDITLDDLNRIDRTIFTLEDLPENGETLDPVSRWNPREFYKQLTRDALWSDPVDYHGLHESVRGAGVAFGPDVTRNFLEYNHMKLVIRSHECIRSGYDEPFTSENADATKAPLLCTIFSASDYGGSGNSAAYMEFHVKAPEVSEEEIKLDLSRSTSNMSLDGGSSKRLSGKASSLKRASLSIKQQGDVPLLLSPSTADDNTSDVKYIEGSHLYYRVHYFYAEPLTLEPADGGDKTFSERHSLTHIETSDDLSETNLTTRDRLYAGGSGGSALHMDHNGSDGSTITSSTLTTSHESANLPLPPIPPLALPPLKSPGCLVLPSIDENGSDAATPTKNRTRRISFGGTTIVMDEAQHNKEQHLITHIDPTAELLQDRKIVLGSALSVDELIYQRKKLLEESFEKIDVETSGLVSQKDWMKVMFEILNVSISWRKFGRYLIREEDRVPFSEVQKTNNTVANNGVSNGINSKESSATTPRGTEKMDRLRRLPPASGNGAVSTSQSSGGSSNGSGDGADNFYIKYRNFLSRYVDEDTKEKKLEQDKFNAAIFKRFHSSNSSLLNSSSSSASVSSSSLVKEAENKDDSNNVISISNGGVTSVSNVSAAVQALTTVNAADDAHTKNGEKTTTVQKDDPNLISLSDYNRFYGGPSTNNTTTTSTNGYITASNGATTDNAATSDIDEKHYFGYEIPEYVIASIYSNYKQLEHLFLVIDEDRDGFLRFEDLARISELVKVNDVIQSEIHDYPMIKNIRFSPHMIMNLLDINRQDCVDMNTFFEIFRLSILNKLYDREASNKPLLARETSYAVELHRLSHANSILFNANANPTSNGGLVSPSLKVLPNQSALSSLELKKGIEISVDNELITTDNNENVGLSIDI